MALEERPNSLRKACRQCTVAKRRCVIRFPYCERCSKKGLDCRYELEPLTKSPGFVHKPNQVLDDLPGKSPIHCLLNRDLESDHQTAPLFLCSKPNVREGIEYVVSTLSSIPRQVLNNKPSVFIHPRIRHSEGNRWLSTAIEDLRTVRALIGGPMRGLR